MSDRDIRKLMNSTAPSINTDGSVSRSIPEGSTNFVLSSNRQLAMFKKYRGRLWKTYFSKDGNQYVDRTLRTNTLEYTHKFIDYRVFLHNFSDTIGTAKVYIPWWGTSESSSMADHRVGFITPFRMTLHKIILRCATINTTTDIVVRVETTGNNDTTAVVATATYDESVDGTLLSNTNFELATADFDNTPVVNAGIKTGISIDAVSSPTSGTEDWWVTSVWRIEVTI
jgi:hypothetical protein